MNVSRVIKLKDHEEVLAVVRSHWITSFWKWFGAFLCVAAAFFLMLPLFKAGWRGVAGFLLFVAVGLFIAARTFVAWYWNAFIITSLRVIDVGQKGFFDRTVSEATYDNLQNVSYAVKGVLGTIFRLGSLELQTASTGVTLALRGVSDPKEVHHLVTGAMAAYKMRAAGASAPSVSSVSKIRDAKLENALAATEALDETETRALLVSLQDSLSRKKRTDAPRRVDDKDLEWLAGDDNE